MSVSVFRSLEEWEKKKTGIFTAVLPVQDAQKAAALHLIPEAIAHSCGNENVSKYESHEGFDFITIHVMDAGLISGNPRKLCIFFSKDYLLFFYSDSRLREQLLQILENGDTAADDLSRVLYRVFDRITHEDNLELEQFETAISSLEESLFSGRKKKNYITEIMSLRKKLLILRRHYERLVEILEELEDNENGLIAEKKLRYFHMISNRANRLLSSVTTLRDYIAQVREAYQAQEDYEQNSLMRFFTVVTTIFLPLTLVAGWYGMNLKMPEYHAKYAYPVVIIFCILVILVNIIIFKKKKWF